MMEKLRAKDIVKLYGIGLSTVWYYAKLGKLKPIKVSDRITVFDKKAVDKLFNGTSVGTSK